MYTLSYSHTNLIHLAIFTPILIFTPSYVHTRLMITPRFTPMLMLTHHTVTSNYTNSYHPVISPNLSLLCLPNIRTLHVSLISTSPITTKILYSSPKVPPIHISASSQRQPHKLLHILDIHPLAGPRHLGLGPLPRDYSLTHTLPHCARCAPTPPK